MQRSHEALLAACGQPIFEISLQDEWCVSEWRQSRGIKMDFGRRILVSTSSKVSLINWLCWCMYSVAGCECLSFSFYVTDQSGFSLPPWLCERSTHTPVSYPEICRAALKIKFLLLIIFLVIRKYTCSHKEECSDACRLLTSTSCVSHMLACLAICPLFLLNFSLTPVLCRQQEVSKADDPQATVGFLFSSEWPLPDFPQPCYFRSVLFSCFCFHLPFFNTLI